MTAVNCSRLLALKTTSPGTLLYMPVREAPDRRGRPLRGRMGLLERESPLQAITAALESIAAGDGAALLQPLGVLA